MEARWREYGERARAAATVLARTDGVIRNAGLREMAKGLLAAASAILEANGRDMGAAREHGLSRAMLDRLYLDERRVEEMAKGLLGVAELPDPIGQTVARWRRPNGLEIAQVRVPLGVIGMIYEARPNVTVDAAGLCLKTGNAVILRGGSEALESNRALVTVLREAMTRVGLPADAVQLLDDPGREAARALMRLSGYLDVLIPRGGAGLIQTVVENATVPTIETGVGNCHVYVDEGCDHEMAERIVINAKCQRPAVCNAMETLLVHEAEAPIFLPRIAAALQARGVEIRGCPRTRTFIPQAVPATEEDWATEYLDLILAVKVVASLDEALAHIARYGTKHSEAIVTRDYTRARRFLREVDAAAVYVNASTRFTDGFQFGFGAEIGISTQKLHARGPMGLEALTSVKYEICGDGQIRE
ncbi:MAG: glutamate-5-semialdehyde dehydrogenase [Firmicutes bacterium]|nr:glutamate-5-semialdehyde dehydrogenase [Bacillota bacterium]